MENDASSPPSHDDVLSRLRTQEFRTLDLEAEIAVLQLKITHNLEDIAAAQAERNRYKARWERSERELSEVRAKYEGLKRKVSAGATVAPGANSNFKRKHELDTECGERRDAGARGERCPAEELSSPTISKLPDPITRKVSSSSTDDRDTLWPKSPVVTTPSLPAHALSLSCERTNDPRKRPKLDPASSPDLHLATNCTSLPPSLSANSSASSLPSSGSASSLRAPSPSESLSPMCMSPTESNSCVVDANPNPNSNSTCTLTAASAHLTRDPESVRKRFPTPASTSAPTSTHTPTSTNTHTPTSTSTSTPRAPPPLQTNAHTSPSLPPRPQGTPFPPPNFAPGQDYGRASTPAGQRRSSMSGGGGCGGGGGHERASTGQGLRRGSSWRPPPVR